MRKDDDENEEQVLSRRYHEGNAEAALPRSPVGVIQRAEGNGTMKPENVTCPDCNGPMTSRTSAHGVFWGCKAYPKCKGTRNSMGDARTRFEADVDERHELPSQRWASRDRRRWE